MSSARFKGVNSTHDILGWQKDSFANFLKLNSSGVSEYTMEQIKAKSATLGLTDSLTTQAIAMAKDADFSAKAATGKLTYGKALIDNADDIDKIADALEKSGKIPERQAKVLSTLEKGSDDYNQYVKNIINGTKDIEDSVIDLGVVTQSSSTSLSTYFRGLGASIKGFFTSTLGITTLVVGAIAAVGYAVNKYYKNNFDYDTAADKASNAASNAEEQKSKLESLKSQLEETNSQIENIQSKGTLTLTDEADLARLKEQSKELQTQLEIQSKINDSAQKEKSKTAEEALEKLVSSDASMYDDKGRKYANGRGFKEKMTNADALELDTKKINEYESAIKKLQKKQSRKGVTQENFDKYQEQIERYQSAISTLETEANTLSDNIQTQLGNIGDKTSDVYRENYKALNNYLNRGMSEQEKATNALDSYFSSSSSTLKQRLIDAAKNGENVAKVLNSLGLKVSDLGDGVTNDTLSQYFKDIAKSANEAADAVNKVNNNLTVDDVGTAFESKNAGDNYVSLNDYLKKAKDLYDKGLVGTDDFKSVAEAISYNIDSSTESFKANYDKLQRYFTEDSDGNLTGEGINNFLTDLQNLNKGYATWDENSQKWTLNMDNTAQAAKDMGLSVQSFEAILGRIQDYDNVGDFKFTSAIEEFNEAKDSLTQLQEVYDSMGEGKEKDALGKKLEQWTPLINQAEDDLASLPKEVVTQLKFEYDKSQLQQMANDATEQAKASGWGDITTNANAIVTQENYKQKLLEGVDISSVSQNKIPIYFDAENAITNLKAQLGSGTLDQETTLKVQAEIANLTGLQNDIIEAFQNAHPEITPETDPSVANATFEEWVQSAEGKKVVANVTADNKDAIDKINELTDSKYNGATINVDADTSNAKSKIDGVLSNDGKTIVMDVDATTDEIQNQISNLENGQTLLFKAEVDGKVQGIEAIKDENGDITYTANIDGVERTVDEIKNEDGTITYHADGEQPFDSDIQVAVDYIKASQEEPETKVALLDYIKSHQDDPEFKTALMDYIKSGQQDPDAKQALLDYINSHQDEPSAKTADVNYLKGSQQNPNSPVNGFVNWGLGAVKLPNLSLTGIINWVSGGSGKGKLSGTAHINGTAGLYPIPKLSGRALAMGTLQDDSWLKPQWRTNKSETALTGEEGQELVVTRQNRWFTVGDKGAEFASIPAGSVVFDAKQTKELLSKGFTYSRGKSYLSGTSYLGSSSGGFSFGGGASKYNQPSYSPTPTKPTSTKSTPITQTPNTSNAQKDAKEATEHITDWIETLLSRTSRLTELAVDAIERSIGLINKQNASADAISKVQNEIAVNQQAAQKYLEYANGVGLSGDYVSKIQNGQLNIEDIQDENLQKSVSKYKDFYEDYLKASDKVLELQDKLSDLAEKRLEIVEKEYDSINNIQESLRKALDSRHELNDALGTAIDNPDNIDLINKSIKSQSETYDILTKKLNDCQTEISYQLSNGLMQEGSDAYREAMKNIQDFTADIYNASKELIAFNDKLTQIKIDTIQNVIDMFERQTSKLDKYVSLLNAQDKTVPENVYQQQIDNNNSQILENQKQRVLLLKKQAVYDVNSDAYKKIAEDINKLDESTLDLVSDNEKLKDSIYELRFKNIDDAIENYKDLESELKNFRDLLNDDAFVDKQGGITDDGLAQIALLQQSIGNAKKKISDYTTGLQKLKESYDNGVISLKEYNEKSDEYRNGIQDSVKDVKSFNDELTNLYMTSMKTEVDYLDKIIDKRKKALNAQKDVYEYDRKVKSQSKDINSLKSQIAALNGTNDIASQSKLKKLKADLADAEQDLKDTKHDHAIEMQQQGFDAISDDLHNMLEDTEYAISHNADKQIEIINSMLNKTVASYQDAYAKINSIISNTGWVGSADFNNNQSQLGTQSGAQSQKDNAVQSQEQANTTPSTSASGTVTSPISDNGKVNDDIVQEIIKPENTTNRKVAELKVSPTSVTLEEGKSTSVTATMRPNDAANKMLKWESSNTAIATVSNGTIKAVKPGSCQIVVSTTDGSGLSVTVGVTVNKKPEPPKPAPAPSTGGDGIPRVGDVVTFNGRYYYDSWGQRPAGNLYSGVPRGVVIDGMSGSEYGGQSNFHGGLGIHIKSADGRYGDLGWVSLSQISGYASGTKSMDKDKLAITDEKGEEIRVTPDGGIITKHGILRKVERGTGIIPHNLTENLYQWGAINPASVLSNITMPNVEYRGNDVKIEQHYDNLINVEVKGDMTRDALPEFKDILKQSCDYTLNHLYKEAEKAGIRRRR